MRLAHILRLALFFALAGVLGFSTGTLARQRGPNVAVSAVSVSEIPIEAQQTLRLVRRGGPFPFPHRDGSIFGNFEHHLPVQAHGYYREYTVPTPGRQDRGARRLIAGQGRYGDVTTSGEYYYTDDHYRHYRRIIPP